MARKLYVALMSHEGQKARFIKAALDKSLLIGFCRTYSGEHGLFLHNEHQDRWEAGTKALWITETTLLDDDMTLSADEITYVPEDIVLLLEARVQSLQQMVQVLRKHVAPDGPKLSPLPQETVNDTSGQRRPTQDDRHGERARRQ